MEKKNAQTFLKTDFLYQFLLMGVLLHTNEVIFIIVVARSFYERINIKRVLHLFRNTYNLFIHGI